MTYLYTDWLPFNAIYQWNPKAGSRNGQFIPQDPQVTAPVAGVYLIADTRLGSLSHPDSVIYIGKAVGHRRWSSFHERLWKHACKAIGECGGTYHRQNGGWVREHQDRTEPRDTRNWARYRNEVFQDFSTWYFSFCRLDEADFAAARNAATQLEDMTLHAYRAQAQYQLPICNGTGPRGVANANIAIHFPWQ